MSETTNAEWVDWQNTKVLQKAAVIDEAGNILVMRRSETRPGTRPGKWDLPGGSIEQRDVELAATSRAKPHELAMRREIIEETGLAALAVTVSFVDSWTFERSPGTILGIAIGYKATVAGAKPAVLLSDEHAEYTWSTPEEVFKLDFGEDGGLHQSVIRAVLHC